MAGEPGRVQDLAESGVAEGHCAAGRGSAVRHEVIGTAQVGAAGPIEEDAG